jgi:hypothetical protein
MKTTYTSSSPFTGLPGVIIALIVVGVIVGAALASTDVLNFITNSQKANTQSNLDAIDLKYYDLQKGSETEKVLTQNQIDAQLYPEKVRMEMNFNNAVKYGLLAIGLLAAILLIGTPAFLILRKAAAQRSAEKEPEKDLWNNPAWKQMQIRLARQQEELSRLAKPEEPGNREQKEVIQRRTPYDGRYISINKN